MATTLHEALPEIVNDVVGALVRQGRGAVADQLGGAMLHAWTFDDFAQTTYLHLTLSRDRGAAQQTISFFDDIGVDVDLDRDGQVVGLEVSGYEDCLGRLGDFGAEPADGASPRR